jgi:hypothetical protein
MTAFCDTAAKRLREPKSRTLDRWPLAADAEDEVEARRGPVGVMVVDDNGDGRSSLADMLATAGYHPLEAADGLAALQLAEDHPGCGTADARPQRRRSSRPARAGLRVVRVERM